MYVVIFHRDDIPDAVWLFEDAAALRAHVEKNGLIDMPWNDLANMAEQGADRFMLDRWLLHRCRVRRAIDYAE